MATGTSFLTGGDTAAIRQAKRDALATRLNLADPPVTIALERKDVDTGVAETLDPVTVAVHWDGPGAERASDTGGTAPVSGTFAAFEPWDVERGDRFELPGGETGAIGFVRPVDAGIVRATFTIDIGR